MRGATVTTVFRARVAAFQSTRPVRGATIGKRLCVIAAGEFQSTRPVRGATTPWTWKCRWWRFQSTRPVRGATFRQPLHGHYAGISIHAPRAGRDITSSVAVTHAPTFQSTRPVRGATPVPYITSAVNQFQSTRPVRGATARPMAATTASTDFNPRAPCGARRAPDPRLSGYVPISIHAPRAGRDGRFDPL